MLERWISMLKFLEARASRLAGKAAAAGNARKAVFIFALSVLQSAAILLAVPVYVFVTPAEYKKFYRGEAAAADYKFKRLVTLSVLGGLLLLVVIKAAAGIIFSIGIEHDRGHYSAGSLLALKNNREIIYEKNIRVLSEETRNMGAEIVLNGIAPAGSTVVVFIDSEPEVAYETIAEGSGSWQINHLQQNLKLAPGAHSATALVYSSNNPQKVLYGDSFSFNVENNPPGIFFKMVNPATILLFALAMMVLGIINSRLKKFV